MRVACYERVSTEEQRLHGLSIDAQKSALEEWAQGHTLVGHYTDAGISGRIPATKRPELQRLLRDIEAGKVDLVAFTKLDRWFRSIAEYYKVQDVLDRNGVAWRAIHEDYETETASGRLKVNIMLAVAQDEADRTSERIRAVFDDKRRRGLVPTGSVPLGIRLENGRYTPSDDADKVREIFTRYISSRSVSQTAVGTPFTANGIRYLLRNEVYLTAGVIDRETWDKAHEILASRSQRHERTDRVYLFSGLLRCGVCGCSLTCVTIDNERGGKYIYYRCPNHVGKGGCPGSHVSERVVERFLLDNVVAKAEEYNLVIGRERERRVDVSALKARRDKLTDLYLSDLIDREKYQTEFNAVQTAIEDAERDVPQIDTEEVKTALTAYDGLSRHARKAFWSHLIKQVVVDGKALSFEVNF